MAYKLLFAANKKIEEQAVLLKKYRRLIQLINRASSISFDGTPDAVWEEYNQLWKELAKTPRKPTQLHGAKSVAQIYQGIK